MQALSTRHTPPSPLQSSSRYSQLEESSDQPALQRLLRVWPAAADEVPVQLPGGHATVVALPDLAAAAIQAFNVLDTWRHEGARVPWDRPPEVQQLAQATTAAVVALLHRIIGMLADPTLMRPLSQLLPAATEDPTWRPTAGALLETMAGGLAFLLGNPGSVMYAAAASQIWVSRRCAPSCRL